MTCTFFGHKTAPNTAEPLLRETLTDLIENHSADTFYVGNQGGFDSMARKVLKELKQLYPHIDYRVVLAYLPTVKKEFEDYSDTMYPEGLETVPKKFAVIERNKWMAEHSDTVIAYVKYSTGGAAKFKELAEKKGKTVINIAK